jgi:hypothetical protein
VLARSLALLASLSLSVPAPAEGPAPVAAPAQAAPAAPSRDADADALAPEAAPEAAAPEVAAPEAAAPAAAPAPEEAASASAPARAPAEDPVTHHPVIAPRSNEAMEFSVAYLGLKVGKVRLFVGSVDTTVAPVFLQAQTSSVLSFITLRQQLATYLDVETGLPRSATLDAVEGSYRHSDTTKFDRTANKATVRVKGKYDNTYVVDTPPGTIDFVGLVYRLRTLPLEDGARYPFPVLAGRRLNSVVAEVVGRETVETRIGDFRAVKVRVPTGFTGKFSEKNPTHVWLSDDARRMVVRITSDFAVGHATATLVSYAPGAPPPPPALSAADGAAGR